MAKLITQERVRRAGKVLGVLAVAALAFELFLRLFGYGSYILYRPDEELLWLPVPNQQAKTVVNHEPITMNEDSLRYRASLGRADPGQTRIFAFGDSVTMGWGVVDDSHYAALLESRLQREAPERGFRVGSAGVNAYPVVLCTRRFLKLIEEGHQMDVVVLAYSFNESFASLAGLEGKARERLLLRVGLKRVVRQLAIYNFLIEDLLKNAVYYPIRDRLLPGSSEVSDKPIVERDLSDYTASLESLRLGAERNNVKVVFLLLGSLNQRRLRTHQTAFLDFASVHGIPVANMVARIEPLDHGGLFMDHIHPTREGHVLIANELAPLVEKVLAADPG